MCIIMQGMSSWPSGSPGGQSQADSQMHRLPGPATMDEQRLLELARRLHGLGAPACISAPTSTTASATRKSSASRRSCWPRAPASAPDALRADWAAETGYVTPKVEVRGAVFRAADEHVLLVRETADGLWTLPGGWADVNDSPSGAIRREIEQEVGISRARRQARRAVRPQRARPHAVRVPQLEGVLPVRDRGRRRRAAATRPTPSSSSHSMRLPPHVDRPLHAERRCGACTSTGSSATMPTDFD